MLDIIITELTAYYSVIMPRCACASEVYGSVFVLYFS